MYLIIAHTFQRQLGEPVGVTEDGATLHLLSDDVTCVWCGTMRQSKPGATAISLFLEPCPRGRGYADYVEGL